MKKSLIALAVMAASGAAMAQSSVTLYGILDLWVGSVDNGSSTTTTMGSGGVNGSRWGMKGSEDLGGGLKANFDLQQGFAMDTGALGNTAAGAFARQSWVGVSGGFGATRFGRTTTPYDDVGGASNAVFDSALSPFGNIALSSGYTGRPNNTFYYQAPDMGGFSGAFSYSLAESATADDTISANLTYSGGPFKAQLGYQLEGENTSLTAAAAEKEFLRLGASYAFGALTAKGTFGRVENVAGINGKDATDWQLGLDYAMGPWVFSGSYAEADIDSYGTNAEENRMGYGVGATYTLSKRTFIYGGYEADTTEQRGKADKDHSLFAIGLQHRF